MVRLKNRYMVVEIIPENPSNTTNTVNSSSRLYVCLVKNIEKYYGDFGVASVKGGFNVKYYNEQTKIAIIRARHGPNRFVSSCLPLITVINGERAKFRLIYMGATIKHCNKHIINYQQNYIDKMVGKNLQMQSKS